MSAIAIKVDPRIVGTALRLTAKGLTAVGKKGLRVAAERGRADLKTKTPVFDGQMKNAWRLRQTDSGYLLVNEAPHAGVIESGARPHGVSEEGRAAIREWVRRVIKRTYSKNSANVLRRGVEHEDAEIDRITWAIVQKIKVKGQEGKHFVRDALPLLQRWAVDEVMRQIVRLSVDVVQKNGDRT